MGACSGGSMVLQAHESKPDTEGLQARLFPRKSPIRMDGAFAFVLTITKSVCPTAGDSSPVLALSFWRKRNQPVRASRERLPHRRCSIVILEAKVRDQIYAHNVAQRVLELHRLDEQIVFRIQPRSRLWRLQVEAQPLLNSNRLE